MVVVVVVVVEVVVVVAQHGISMGWLRPCHLSFFLSFSLSPFLSLGLSLL